MSNDSKSQDDVILEEIKTLIDFDDISEKGERLEKKLKIWVKHAEQAICLYVGIDKLPELLTGTVVEMAQAKFVKLGYEGTTSANEEGLVFTWSASDLEPYKDELDQFKKRLPGADDYGWAVTVD
ncbi:hypothetical protein FEZ51_02120 [Pediococcus stilesii]|uniref:Phage protein n=1 Tax=Pediococcus stilesii TaxID=331679 RepID=A0A5R9BXN8_9LACO|nr:phage head-tail connector protein [Pediococcus stilesii]TLQ05476.1 hypothetical protein FEZ51_02120 [Pediococcus stilesii]